MSNKSWVQFAGFLILAFKISRQKNYPTLVSSLILPEAELQEEGGGVAELDTYKQGPFIGQLTREERDSERKNNN